MSFLERIFGGNAGASEPPIPASETETVRRITDALDRLGRRQAKFIACFAYLLGRVANANMDISKEESREMELVVIERGELPEEQAIIVVQIAKTQNLLFGHTENFLVAREFNQIASREEKLALLDCLFAVSAADDEVSTVEDNVIRNIADELKLDHGDFIDARCRWRDYLAVLKKRPERST